jgi:hypothetical protein
MVASFVTIGETKKRVSPIAPALGDAQAQPIWRRSAGLAPRSAAPMVAASVLGEISMSPELVEGHRSEMRPSYTLASCWLPMP